MKTKIVIAAVIIAVLIVAALLSLSLNYIPAPKPRVEITSFASTGTSSGSSLGVVNVWFILNLTNTGTVDAQNLAVTFSTNRTIENHKQLVYANSTPPHDQVAEFEIGQSCLLGGMKAGEAKYFMFYWAVSLGFDAPPLTAILKSNEVMLDQAIITIPPLPNVKITNFIYLGVWHGTRLGGLLDLFSLSYTNLGTADVEDLGVELSTSKVNENYTVPEGSYPNRLFDESINGEIYPLESLKAKEIKTFEKSYWDYDFLFKPFALTATLKSHDTILDQATIMIPISDY